MPLFLLIRHGENDYVKKGRLAGRLPGVHLNETGRKQAQAVAEQLGRMAQASRQAPAADSGKASKKSSEKASDRAKENGGQIKAIYSSPMERAMETATPIAHALGQEIIQRPGLIEIDVGEWQDQTLKGLNRLKLWKQVQSSPSMVRFPGGESFAEAQHRICGELQSLAGQHDPKDVVICVSHSDPIKLAVAFFIGLPLDLFQRLSVSPASITTLYIGEGPSRLMALNFDLSFTIR